MKKNIFFVFILVGMIFPISLAADTAKETVAIVYNGATGVNKKAINHINKEAPHLGFEYSFKPVKAGTEIKPGEFVAVIVLNSDRESGLDPVLAEYINNQQDTSHWILVSLIKDSQDFTVEHIAASPETGGVDAVSAASQWKSISLGFKGNREIVAMHDEWLTYVLSLIQDKNS